jgi:glycosyltransferase involved in cell wall biosynthesis
MNVSVVVTVKNEGETIRPLLESLIDQTRRPSEIVICDGGSTDQTLAILAEYERWLPLKIVSAPGSNISQGRNRAIANAAGPILAVTDAGVVLAPVWLEELVQPIESRGAVAVSGWFEPDPYTDFEVVLGATILPELKDIRPGDFLPSSRSIAFLKAAWAAVGGYPEWLDYGEDLVFDLSLRQEYGTFAFAPWAVVYYRPRRSLSAFARQYYLYGRGDGKANLWPKRHAVRYATYFLALPSIFWLIWREKWYGWLLLLAGISVYCRRPVERLWPSTSDWRPPSRARAFALIPIIRLVGDFAKMVGYPAGLIWRWRRQG